MGFGLYIHWPYCESKCPYCDFNSHVASRIDGDRWVMAYSSEIRRIADLYPNEILSTIFFGGGTPSLMEPRVMAAAIDAARAAWPTSNDLEVTFEANPGSVDAGRFRDYAAVGATRVSIGIQSLEDHHLRLLGRKHDSKDARRAIETAQSVFERVNLDLIYARQHQTPDDWRQELEKALAFGTGHLSLYQLTIEDGTVFGRRHALGQLRGLPDEDRSVDMFAMTQEICEKAGLPSYEISNHAAPDQECRHNLIYWRGGRYAAVGPGAHGRLGEGEARIATEAIMDPAAWLAAVEGSGNGDLVTTPLGREDRIEEALLMGLRLREGLQVSRLEAEGVDLKPWASLRRLQDDGFLTLNRDVIRTTSTGRLLLNAIIAELAADLPPGN